MKFLISVCLISLAACSTSFAPKVCSLDTDCAEGQACVSFGEEGFACVNAADAPITVGQSAAVSGPNQVLGTDMRLGIEAAFKEVNDAGGIRGRMLRLKFRDDGYEPVDAEANARDLVNAVATNDPPKCPSTNNPAVATQQPVSRTALERGPDGVFAVIGSVGAPTGVRAAPIVIETGSLFFGAFTGAGPILRDDNAGDCKRFIFNVRASYAQEALATTLFFKSRGIEDVVHYISFDQNDSFGQAGYDGLTKAFEEQVGPLPAGEEPIARFRYTPNDDSSVPDQAAAATIYLASLLEGNSNTHSVGVLMTDTAGAGALFIKLIRDWQYADDTEQTMNDKANKLELFFSNVSFVGPNALANNLQDYGKTSGVSEEFFTNGVIVSQVVPNYLGSDESPVVRDYRVLVAEQDQSYTSLEGYVAGRVFAAGLQNHTGPLDAESLIKTFENLPDLALGLGSTAGFSADDHQYSKSLWGTLLTHDGVTAGFSDLYFWSKGRDIQFF